DADLGLLERVARRGDAALDPEVGEARRLGVELEERVLQVVEVLVEGAAAHAALPADRRDGRARPPVSGEDLGRRREEERSLLGAALGRGAGAVVLAAARRLFGH